MCILDRKQVQIKHKQADLRGSPKPGTSTETADCILLEEWYKHSTQPSTIPQNPVFHSYTRCFSQICTCTHSHNCIIFFSALDTLPLHFLYTSLHSLVSVFIGEYRSICAANYYNEQKSWWLEKSWQICYNNIFESMIHLVEIFIIEIAVALERVREVRL